MNQFESNISNIDVTHYNDVVEGYSNLFGEKWHARRAAKGETWQPKKSRREKRKEQQMNELKRIADESGLPKEEVEKSIRKSGGINKEALIDLLAKAATFGAALAERKRSQQQGTTPYYNTPPRVDYAPPPTEPKRILGMKPLAFTGVAILVVGAIGFTVWKINKARKTPKITT